VLLLHLVAAEAVIDQHCIKTTHTVTTHHLHTTRYRRRHVQALDLDQVSHILPCTRVRELSLDLLLGGHLLLHLELNVVEDSIEVNRVELDGHLYSWVLLEVHQGCLALLRVDHSRRALDALALLHRDLFSVEYHQLYQALYHNHAVVGLAGDRVMNQ